MRDNVTQLVNFTRNAAGDDYATIVDTDNEVLEIVRRDHGDFELIAYNRRTFKDEWDEVSVILNPRHLAALGSLAKAQKP